MQVAIGRGPLAWALLIRSGGQINYRPRPPIIVKRESDNMVYCLRGRLVRFLCYPLTPSLLRNQWRASKSTWQSNRGKNSMAAGIKGRGKHCSPVNFIHIINLQLWSRTSAKYHRNCIIASLVPKAKGGAKPGISSNSHFIRVITWKRCRIFRWRCLRHQQGWLVPASWNKAMKPRQAQFPPTKSS